MILLIDQNQSFSTDKKISFKNTSSKSKTLH